MATPSKTGDKVKISESSKTSIAGKTYDTGKTGDAGKTSDTGKSVNQFFSCKKPVFRYFKKPVLKPVYRFTEQANLEGEGGWWLPGESAPAVLEALPVGRLRLKLQVETQRPSRPSLADSRKVEVDFRS